MRNFKLWLLLAVMVTGTMASGFFFTGFLAYWNFRNNPAIRSEPQVWLPFLTLGITAILVSILLTLLISRRFFQPIEHLIHALKQVTAGDFQVRLPETARDPEIEEMNINFNKMVKELTSMEMLQADFIQNVSHEIKTPLSAIEGYASLLYSEELSEEGKQYMQRILESTKRLSHLTGNILMLSKLENQQIVSKKHPFSLDEQLRQAVLLLEPFWDKKKLVLDIDLPETRFFGSEELLYQVWTNLLSNAIKFTPEGGCILVRLEQGSQNIQVEIRDSGIGMTGEVLSHIFDKFYQGERNRNVEGNGLGLALVKKIIDLCQGTISVESQPGQGSVFRVRLPMT